MANINLKDILASNSSSLASLLSSAAATSQDIDVELSLAAGKISSCSSEARNPFESAPHQQPPIDPAHLLQPSSRDSTAMEGCSYSTAYYTSQQASGFYAANYAPYSSASQQQQVTSSHHSQHQHHHHQCELGVPLPIDLAQAAQLRKPTNSCYNKSLPSSSSTVTTNSSSSALSSPNYSAQALQGAYASNGPAAEGYYAEAYNSDERKEGNGGSSKKGRKRKMESSNGGEQPKEEEQQQQQQFDGIDYGHYKEAEFFSRENSHNDMSADSSFDYFNCKSKCSKSIRFAFGPANKRPLESIS